MFLGLLFGLWFVGIKNVFPTNTDWITKGDSLSSQIQWSFYRTTPIVQWPITAIPNYGESLNTVVGSGIALVEIPLKLVNQLLPRDFQYFGIWIVACFALQGLFAARILEHFKLRTLARIIGSVMFITSPILVMRVAELGHPMLAAQFLILASIDLYLKDSKSERKWRTLLAITMLTNLYIFVIVYSVYLARALQNMILLRVGKDIKTAISKVFISTSLVLFIFILLGYFEFRNSELGAGFFRLDIYAFINPGYAYETTFSLIANLLDPDHSSIRRFHDYEGVAYIGLVPIIGLMMLLFGLKRKEQREEILRNAGIVLCAITLYLLALSNKISIAGFEVSYWWPPLLNDFRQAFRAATRFSWLLYYLFLLFGLVSIFRFGLKDRIRSFVVLSFVLFHFVDIYPGISHLRNKQIEFDKRISSLTSPAWDEIARDRSHLILYPNFDLQTDKIIEDTELWNEHWQDFALYAVKKGMSTNFVYTSRSMFNEIEAQNRSLRLHLLNGDIDRSDIWVVADRELIKLIENKYHNLQISEIDGYWVVYFKSD